MSQRSILATSLAIVLLVAFASGAEAVGRNRVLWVALEGAGELAKGRRSRRRSSPCRYAGRLAAQHYRCTRRNGGGGAVGLGRMLIFRDGERSFVELGGAPHDVKIARNMVVVANQATERVQLVKLDGTFLRRILPQGESARPRDRPERATRVGHARG